MKKGTNYRLYVPKSIDLDVIKESYPQFKSFSNDKAYFILYLINRKTKNNTRKDGHVELSSVWLKKVGVQDFSKYWKYLKNAGVIEGKNYSADLGYCRSFKITDKYRDISKIYTIEKKSFAMKVKKALSISMRDIKNNINLYKSFNEHLTVDYDEAMSYISYVYDSSKKTDSDIIKYNYNLESIDCIHVGHYRFYQDETSGRIHTVLTNMKREVRQFVKYRGESLINLDFKNSQPFISSVLFNEDFYTNNIEKGYKGLGSNKLATFSDCNNCNDYISEDVAEYIELVINGGFYEKYQSITGIKDRTEAKVDCLKLMYSSDVDKKGKERLSKSKKQFIKHFPNVYDKFRCMKKDNHKHFAILMQSLESSLFIGRICSRIRLERPELALFTLHDSIMVTKGAADYIKNVMIEETEIMLGIKPTISVE